MASAARTFLWAWLIASSMASPAALPQISNQAFIDECVREHNRARSSVVPAASDMLYMVGLPHLKSETAEDKSFSSAQS